MKNWIDIIGDKLTYLNGGFYSNKSDARFLVPKEPPGVGWNLNFGNPKAVRSFIIVILIILAMFITLIAVS